MKVLISAITFVSVLKISNSLPVDDVPIQTRKVSIYVVIVPHDDVQNLTRVRQEDEDERGFAETGAHVGEIVRGVLTGNVSQIFAGGLSIVPNADVSDGVGTILSNVAPTVTNILKQLGNRALTAFGITSTPRPGSLNNGTYLSNYTFASQSVSPNPNLPVVPYTTTPISQYEQTTLDDNDNEDESDNINHLLPK
ncbi:unnamed protein product [Orchesella dallaii]|uniref:Uncharacterized protein n=1 Tax=Orchesella dallaii TaxID=48710 RepID=A0ABP1PRZ3_9HEXA